MLEVSAFEECHHSVAAGVGVAPAADRGFHRVEEVGDGRVTEDVEDPACEVPAVHVVGDDLERGPAQGGGELVDVDRGDADGSAVVPEHERAILQSRALGVLLLVPDVW